MATYWINCNYTSGGGGGGNSKWN